MATKLWVGDKIFLVDDEVYDEWERLTAEVSKFKEMAQERARTKHKAIDEIDELQHQIDSLTAVNAALVLRCADNGIDIKDIFDEHGCSLR